MNKIEEGKCQYCQDYIDSLAKGKLSRARKCKAIQGDERIFVEKGVPCQGNCTICLAALSNPNLLKLYTPSI